MQRLGNPNVRFQSNGHRITGDWAYKNEILKTLYIHPHFRGELFNIVTESTTH